MATSTETPQPQAPGAARQRPITGVILAGGLSRRMGRDKAALSLAGRSLLEWTVARLRPVCRELVVSARDPSAGDAAGLPTLLDQTERLGPVGGIVTALRAFGGKIGPDGVLFICGCDMPFASAALIRHLASRLADRHAVGCRTTNGLEPLHAVWGPSALPVVERLVCGGPPAGATHTVHKILGSSELDALILDEAHWRPLDPEGRSFFNVNTAEDLAQAEEWLATDGS